MIRRGTYILVVDMPESEIRIGALGIVRFREGSYCYVGSAMNGLDQRIGRHLSKNKKLRWHIDYLTSGCRSVTAFESVLGTSECGLGSIILECGGSPFLKGFGCSDCGCITHLFLLDEGSKEKVCSDPRFSPYIQQLARG